MGNPNFSFPIGSDAEGDRLYLVTRDVEPVSFFLAIFWQFFGNFWQWFVRAIRLTSCFVYRGAGPTANIGPAPGT